MISILDRAVCLCKILSDISIHNVNISIVYLLVLIAGELINIGYAILQIAKKQFMLLM